MDTKSQHTQRLQVSCLLVCLMVLVFTSSAQAQATFTGVQLRGTVQDASKAAVPRATVIATNDGTQVSERITTDEQGRYLFNTLQPASYTVKVEAAGFKTVVQPNVVLRVGQQIDLDFALEVGEVTATVQVTAVSPLLNSVSAALGQEVDNHYITEIPLPDRQVLGLAYLAPGVTEIQNGAPFGTSSINFVSNGQRYSTAEVRMDGSIIAAAEGGEGSMYQVLFQPTPDAVQEFKVQNNSFSAEYGNNGGTVINMITKSGTNEFHGSGYWFARRPELDANNFFANRDGLPKPNFNRDQYGGTIGGPIFKQKTFFFFDYDRLRLNSLATLTTTVPTVLQRQGDFSQTFNPDGSLAQIFNPLDVHQDANGNWIRSPFPGNVIPASLLDPVAVELLKFYPLPTGPGDPVTGLNNFTRNGTQSAPAWQCDLKIDHSFSERSRLTARYSHVFQGGHPPEYTLDVNPYSFSVTENKLNNAVIQHVYMINPTTVWTNQFALERANGRLVSPDFDLTSVGFPSFMRPGKTTFPLIILGAYGASNWLTYGSGLGDVTNAHTLPHWSSSLSKVMGAHNLKFGGEQRTLLTNYCNNCNAWLTTYFGPAETAQNVFSPAANQGNPIASMLLGSTEGGTFDALPQAPATKSKETAFYVQDDWKATQRLTINLGLRYEWSTPYSERYNQIQYADFTADTGVNVPGLGELRGVSRFFDSHHRNIDPDRNNFAPRLGLAYRLDQKTVIRIGAGVYYGVNPATNYWLIGPAFSAVTNIIPSLDGGITRYASLSDPFPKGLYQPQKTKYGNLDMWGYGINDYLEKDFRNAEIYQWNFGFQRQLPGSILAEVTYSASRGVHLPNFYAANRNFVSSADRLKWGTAGLYEQVPNLFQHLFTGPNAIFNEPTSNYNNPTIPRINLLRPFPQFDGAFGGMHDGPAVGNSSYHSVQLRVEKRYSNGLHFLGSYTFSKMIDDCIGPNAWLVGGFGGWGAQDPGNLRLERSVSSASTPHRLVFSWGYEVPVGRGKPLGRNMNRVLDKVVGGWQVNGFVTYQSGLPLNIGLANPVLADGSQRPNLIGDPRGASIKDTVDGKGIRFNLDAFAHPPDQVPGTAPRYESQVRGDGIHNLDLSVFKVFQFREQMKL